MKMDVGCVVDSQSWFSGSFVQDVEASYLAVLPMSSWHVCTKCCCGNTDDQSVLPFLKGFLFFWGLPRRWRFPISSVEGILVDAFQLKVLLWRLIFQRSYPFLYDRASCPFRQRVSCALNSVRAFLYFLTSMSDLGCQSVAYNFDQGSVSTILNTSNRYTCRIQARLVRVLRFLLWRFWGFSG